MTLPALLRSLSFHSLRLRWLSLCGVVVFAAGCASTGGDTHQAHLRGQDDIAALLESLQSRQGSDANNLVNPADDFVAHAMAHLGTPYQYGGSSPDEGFDCSGLIWFAAKQSRGLKLPRSSAELAREGQQVNRTELQRGDLVFFNTMGRRYSHVGIYLGNGKFVHAPSSGSGVRIDSMSLSYWKTRYNGARRIVPLTNLAAK